MTVERKYLVLFPWELEKYNLKFLVYKDREIVTFCATDFFVKKVVRHDDMFIGLAVLQSAWNMKDLKKQIRRRAPHSDMDDEDFLRVHKSFKAELTRIENQSYYVGEAPEDYMDPEMREEVELLRAKLEKGKRFLKRHPKSTNTIRKHFWAKGLDDLEHYINRLERIYNVPEEEDLWSNHKTSIEDYDIYEMKYGFYKP